MDTEAGTAATGAIGQITAGKKVADSVGALWRSGGKKYKDSFVKIIVNEAGLKRVYNQAKDLERNMDVVESIGKRKMSRRSLLSIPKLFQTNAKAKLDRKAQEATNQTIKDAILPPKDQTGLS